jgi:uncharacterized protein (TIGR02145 family)
MPTARPFARNTGAAITGTTQVGNLAVGIPTAGFAATGLPWWNGPDEDLGYVIATEVAANNQPTPVSATTASVGFWRSTALTDASFIDLAQYVSTIAGTPQTFATASAAVTWLNTNGYWTSYIALGPPTVTIGTQVWTSTNLDVATYRNGDTIPEVTDPTAWAGLTTGAWCYNNNDSANGAIYGKLYNWYAVNDLRGLAPTGFHIPSDAEWTTLGTYLGGDSVAGGKMKTTGTSLWLSPNASATNESGFTGLPGGFRLPDGSFYPPGYDGYWWSSTEFILNYSYLRRMYFNNGILTRDVFGNKLYGSSVRLIKD